MKRESLDRLKAAFEEWRSRKRYRQQAIPAALLDRARRAARRHGSAAVARATKVDRGRLNVEGSGRRPMDRPVAVHTPTFSRVALSAPDVAMRPVVEVEMASGVKVRLFTQTDEVLEWLASLAGPGGSR